MSLAEAYRHHVSNSTFNHAEGDLNQFHVAGNLIQSRGETGWSILQRNIAGDAFYNSEQRFPPPQCHPQTRTAVQKTIQAWAENPHPAPSVMWLYGPAGTGKSAVAQTMAEKWVATHKLAAAFFFARWRVGGSDGKTLFPTIAYQLALHIPSLRKAISLAVEADPAICDKALEDQARVLILDPILALNLNAGNPSLVIVDGLDECDSTIMQNRIVKITFELLANNNLPLRFLICSRPEPRIRESFESLPIEVPFRRVVLDETFDPGRDILRYLRDRLFQVRMQRFPAYNFSWPTERDLDQLVHNASGQFIYATTAIKFVEDEYSHPIEQLRVVLMISAESTDTSPFADLDALYKFILSANPNVSLVLRILGTYFAIPDPDPQRHNTAFLDDILGLYTGSVRSALRGLHSLLFIPDSDQHRIRLHHASLYDFFFNPLRAGIYFLDKQKHDNELAAKCYSLILSEFENPQQNYPDS
ncbi:hypothetical protein B0H16DRAFT_1740976 [Mycena metata]|uniref:Nephrocystin 3-like N-terminal domain-containing protein n=1 Tax=Mycena metata TaxID=1033252 RepID=A0AAD7MGS3_9AGAR|nr:hypothetical protein B0H16DRAFT_1740976 [Mycena metata]